MVQYRNMNELRELTKAQREVLFHWRATEMKKRAFGFVRNFVLSP